MRRSMSFMLLLLAFFGTATLGLAPTAQAQSGQQIYTDTLQNGWLNYSWCATDFSSRDYVHGGADSIKATITGAWQGLYLYSSTPIYTGGYTGITFWINGGATSGRNLVIEGSLAGSGVSSASLNQFIAGGSVAANTWRLVTVPLSAIGLSKTTNMTGFWIQDNSGGAQAAFYVDDVTLVGSSLPTPPQTVTVDFAASKHAINPLIYGVAFATQAQLADLNAPLNRWGGNATSRYNWLQNASNHASDWYFESIPGASSTPGADADSFVSTTQAASAQAMMTLPTLGWVAKLGPNRAKTWSFSQAKYGAQTGSEYDAGNGILKSGQSVTGNDPTDANQTADSLFAQTWVQHFTKTFGTASKGGLSYYLLDNEPSLWHSTHRDVHPVGAKMSEIAAKTEDYAAKIKAADPNALIVGPEEWGWSGYFYSGYDQQYAAAHGWSNLPDRAANGNQDYLPWLLSTLHSYDGAHKTKSLDVLSVHYYPQGGEFSNDVSTAMQQRRNRSTRSLWDPTYVDETWIGTQVQLIPRLKGWVSSNYAGLQTALTEYNWGAEGSINGATTQADIYGIFGREGLDMATRWTTPDASTPTYLAMKMYRNVDGNNHGFGDVSVSDVVSDADTLSSFASVRNSDGAQTIMVINKALSATSATVTLANVKVGGALQAWQLTSSNVITQLADTNVSLSVNGGVTLNLALPAQSVTFYVLPTVITPPVTTPVYQINCGGSAAGTFTADNYYNSGGLTYSTSSSIDTSGVTNAAPQACYQSVRYSYSPLSYTLPNLTAGASYKVRLHFAEISFNSAGMRVFNGSINGTQVLSNFDVYATAGAKNKAIVEEFTTTADSNGYITILLTPITNCPDPCAIEIIANGSTTVPTAPTALTTTAGNAQVTLNWTAPSSGATSYNIKRGTSLSGAFTTIATLQNVVTYTDSGTNYDGSNKLTNGATFYYVVTAMNNVGESVTSNTASAMPSKSTVKYQINCGGSAAGTFTADNYYNSGGLTYSTSSSIDTSGVTNAAPQACYQSVRYSYSPLSYTLPNLTAGASYKVRLHFAEISFNSAGMRVFNGSINGTQVLSNFDVYATAGAKNKAIVEEFTTTADSNGYITILLTPITNCPDPCAIEIK